MGADISGETVMGLEWTLLTLAFMLVATRLSVRLFQQRQSLLVSDILLIVCAIDALGLAVCDTMSYRLGAMSSVEIDESPSAANQREIALDKYSFTSNYFYDTGIYFPKFTILTFYIKLFPPTMPKLRWLLYIAFGYTISCALTTCFMDTFWCGIHVSSNWSTDPDACSTFNSLKVFQIDWAMNLSTDLLVFALPFPLLRKLQLARRQVVGLFVTFALGIITMAVSIGRFVSVQTEVDSYNPMYVWSMAELAVAIIVVSLPALSSLLYGRARTITKTLKSRLHGGGTSSTGQGSHYKLSSTSGTFDKKGKKSRGVDDTGSDVELNHISKAENGIYRVEEVSVESHESHAVAMEVRGYSMEGNGRPPRSWNEKSSKRQSQEPVGYVVNAWSKNE